MRANGLLVLLGRLVASLGISSRTQPARNRLPDLNLDGRLVDAERLGVGVDRDKLDACDPLLDHAVHRVRAGAAHADHLDGCLAVKEVVGSHGSSSIVTDQPAVRLSGC